MKEQKEQKFYCKLKDCPMIPVSAPGKFEALEAYHKFCGVLATENKTLILAENEPVPTDRKDSEELKAERAVADKVASEKGWQCKA